MIMEKTTMKYLYKFAILISIIIINFFFKSIIAIFVCYFILLFLQSWIYKSLIEISRKWANVFLAIFIIVYFLIGLYNREIYESYLAIPAIIIITSKSITFTAFPYSLNLKMKYTKLSQGTDNDQRELQKIKLNNLIIRIIILILIIILFILGMLL